MQKKLSGIAVLLLSFSSVAVAWAADFKDVPPTHPNYKAIMQLKDKGVISGYNDGTFKPDQSVNRVEALKIILGASQISADGDAAMGLAGFSDIDASQWYAKYLRTALNMQIVQGYPDGTFKPTQTVNLVENLKMLLNAQKVDVSKLVVTENPYVDASWFEWYAKYVQFAKMANLLTADANGNVYPAQGMTRAKLAELAYRLLYMQENQLDMYPPQNPNPVLPEGNDNPQNIVTDEYIPVETQTDPNLTPDTPDQLVMKVNITNSGFKLDTMTVGLGTKVVWINNDSVLHSVTSDSGNEISSTALYPGQSYAHVFNTKGTFTYHCGAHPAEKGTIIAKPAIEVPTI